MTHIIILGEGIYQLAQIVTQTRKAMEWENVAQEFIDKTVERLRDSVKPMPDLHGIEQIIEGYRSVAEHPVTRTRLEAIGECISDKNLTLVGLEEVSRRDVHVDRNGWGNVEYKFLLEAALALGEARGVSYISLSNVQLCKEQQGTTRVEAGDYTKALVQLYEERK